MQRRVERGEWITVPPTWIDMPAQKNDGKMRSKSGGVAGRSGSCRENLGQQRQREEERNPDLDPRLRLAEIFREFFCETNRGGIRVSKGAYGREICIKFHFKGNCTHNFS